jgi:hypothetical protein
MIQVQESYKDAEENYGTELLNLVIAKGHFTKLLANEAVKGYIVGHQSENLTHHELVVSTVSMEETIQDQGAESPIYCNQSAAAASPKQPKAGKPDTGGC